MLERRAHAIVIAALLGLLSEVNAQEPTKIGLIEPLTGPVATDGQSVVRGALLAAKEINGNGGVLGQPLEVIATDGACKPADTIAAAEKLLSVDKVTVLEGAFCSGATQALAPWAARNKIPLVTAISTLSSLTEAGNGWFFRDTEKDSMAAAAFAGDLHEHVKFKTVFYLAATDDWGRGEANAFRAAFERSGARTVGVEYFEPGATDFYTIITKIRALNPDLVFMATYSQPGANLMKQARELALQSKLFAVGGVTTPTFLRMAGPAADGLLAAVPYAATAPAAANTAFVRAYRDEYGEQPSKYAMFGYHAVKVIGAAVQRGGSNDPAKIRESLFLTDYDGPTGRIHFDKKGQAYGFNLYLVEVAAQAERIRASKEIDAAAAAR